MLSEHGAAESPVVTSPSARASVTCETPTPRSWTKSTRTMINWWIPREPPLDCSTNSCTSLFFAPGSRIQECNTQMDTFLIVEPNTEPRMKRPLAGSLRFSFKYGDRAQLFGRLGDLIDKKWGYLRHYCPYCNETGANRQISTSPFC